MTRPRTSGRSLPFRLLSLVPLLAAGGCAAPLAVPPVAVVEAAGRAASYRARLDVALRGPDLRARTRVLVGFRRPDALRLEVPGPTGARFIAVAEGGRLWAVFPSERALYAGTARAEELEGLLGVALAPSEVMDLLTGVRPPRLRAYTVRWGPSLPRRVEATLADGTTLRADVQEPEAPALLGEAAFREPPHPGYRVLGLAEARTLWSR